MTMHLALIQIPAVMTAQVNQASVTYPVDQVTMDNVSTIQNPGGDHVGVRPEMTVLFGTEKYDDTYGRQRIRLNADSTTLYFGRSSQGARDGEVTIVDDSWITVIGDYRVWPKIPDIDGSTDPPTIFKDSEIVVGTNVSQPPPVANAGAYMAGTVQDSGFLRVTLPHEANSSFAVDDGATISTYTWELPDGETSGVPVDLISTEGPVGAAIYDTNKVDAQRITVDSPPGWRWYGLTVTDSNGKTHTARVGVYCYDPTDSQSADMHIDSFQITRHTHGPAGQRITFKITEEIPALDYTDGLPVILWEGEPADSEDRSHVIFFGWHQGDPASLRSRRTGIERDVEFDCVDAGGRLAVLPGFPFTVGGDNAQVSGWAYMPSANWFKFLHYLLQWHTGVLDNTDWKPDKSALAGYPFVIRATDAGNMYRQAQAQAQAVVPDYHFTCNRDGQLLTVPDPMIQATGNRTSTVQASLTAADWTAIEYTNQFWPRYHWVREEALLAHASDITALFSISPGESPGMGEGAKPHGEQLAKSQSDLNASCGNRYARLNAPQTPLLVTLAGGDDRGIDPAEMTWVELTIPASLAAQRGFTFTSARGLPLQVEWRYSFEKTGVSKQVVVTWEKETSGNAGVTYTQPEPS